MNNTALAGIIVGAVVIAGAGAIAANSGFNPFQKYATVVAVEPAFEMTHTPRQVCGDEAIAEQAAASGQVAAPEQGAAPAPAPAKDAAHQPAAGQKGNPSEEPCLMVYDTESVQSGYDVTYELDGTQKVVRMDHDPGKRIPVEDGELVLTQR